MTTIRQLIQTSPARANELFASLLETSDTALKTRERVFVDLKSELELLTRLEEEHLFPALKKHKDTKALVSEASAHNREVRKLIAQLEQTPRESEEFLVRVTELKKLFQQGVRDDKNELLPAALKALTDDEAQAIVERIEAERGNIEEARRAEAEQRRVEARHDREQASRALSAQPEPSPREQDGDVASKSSGRVAEGAARDAQRFTTAPFRTGSVFFDAMFGMWGTPPGRSLTPRPGQAQRSTEQEEIIPLSEETLIVGKHTVQSGTTTVRRFVVETPVEQQVSLYSEKVVVERRKPATDAVTGETFTELTVEMIETAEMPLVGKGVKVREEVVVRRERTKRVETVRDTVRRDEIEIARSDENTRVSNKRPAAIADGR